MREGRKWLGERKTGTPLASRIPGDDRTDPDSSIPPKWTLELITVLSASAPVGGTIRWRGASCGCPVVVGPAIVVCESAVKQ